MTRYTRQSLGRKKCHRHFLIRPRPSQGPNPFLYKKLQNNKSHPWQVTFIVGWAGGIRTHEMTESKSVALPLGYSPVFHLDLDNEKAAFASRFLMGWVVRVDLTTSRATIWRPNQLGHTHHIYVARQERLELPTYCLEGSCSIQLSYWRI